MSFIAALRKRDVHSKMAIKADTKEERTLPLWSKIKVNAPPLFPRLEGWNPRFRPPRELRDRDGAGSFLATKNDCRDIDGCMPKRQIRWATGCKVQAANANGVIIYRMFTQVRISLRFLRNLHGHGTRSAFTLTYYSASRRARALAGRIGRKP